MIRRRRTSQIAVAPRLVRRAPAPPPPPRVPLASKIGWSLAITLGVAAMIWLVWPVFSMLVASAALAYVFDPLVDRFERRGLSREVGIAFVFAGLGCATALLLLLLVPAVGRQMSDLAANADIYITRLQTTLEPLAAQIESEYGFHLPVDFADLKEQVPLWVRQLSPDARASITGFLSGLFTSSLGFVITVVNLALLPVFTFFLLRDWDHILAAIGALVPPRYRANARVVAIEVDRRLSGFVQGQITVALILCVLYSIGLWLSGIDLAFPVGIVSGILFIVPYLGTVVGIVLGALLAILKFGFDIHLLYVGLAFAIPQLIEGNLLTPMIVGDRVGLHPMVVMVAILVGGSLLGIWGMLLAIPLTAVLVVLMGEGLQRYRASQFFAHRADDPAHRADDPTPRGAAALHEPATRP